MSGRYRVARTKNRTRQPDRFPLILLVAGILLLIGGLAFGLWASQKSAATALAYEAEDVAAGQPIVARHEMGEGPAIPFLPRSEPQPRIAAPETFYNFGSIGPHDVVQRTFIIRNTGQAPLAISRAYTTCGCTTAEISASVIPPGKVATVRVVFDAGFHDAAGQTVRRGVIIENNDPNRSQVEIWIQAAVRSR